MITFRGTMPALVTPLNEDNTLNSLALCHLITDLLAQGADGFYIGGATGEGIALSREVREELAEDAVKCVAHRKPCIIHVASANFKECIELAKHAERCGADAVSAIPPLFFGYDENDIYEYYKAIANAVHIPVMIYYNLAAGFKFTANAAARMFQIDNITSIKWTSSDYFGMIRLKQLTNGEMNIINGCDEMLLMGLNAGADGGIGTTYNFIYPIIKRIYESFKSGDMAAAQAAQYEADKIIGAISGHYSIIPATKAILEKLGYDVGNATFPMKRFSDEVKEKMFSELREAGLKI